MEILLENNHNFTINSKEVKIGSIFIALKGERDGNDFAEDAFKRGASKLIISKKPNFKIPTDKYILVEDTLKYLQTLANERFTILQKKGIKTVALTGSSGKTTTKDIMLYMLEKSNKKAYGSPFSFNNHIGVPLTILNAPIEIEYLILEMGMNHLNEISKLIKIAPTDIRIILNIMPAHIGNFAEGIKGIAKAKMEILDESTITTKFITIQDLPFFEENISKFKGDIFFIETPKNIFYNKGTTFFEISNNKYSINKIVTKDWLNSISFAIKTLALFNIKNENNFSDFIIPKGRGNEIKISQNSILIDESYNANLFSTLNSIKTLSLLHGKKLLALGDMKELGKESYESHKNIIQHLEALNETDVILVGEEFKKVLPKNIKSNMKFFNSIEELIKNFDIKAITKYNYIMAKSSKSSYISKFVDEILNIHNNQNI